MSVRLSLDQVLIREPAETVDRIKRFLKTHKDKTHASVFVVGMSGGLDSSVTAALCAQAIGGRNVLGISMPERETWDEKNIQDAKTVAKKFGIPLRTVNITELVQAARRCFPRAGVKTDNLATGNVKARLRATVLYYFANARRGLVVGTGDKSEVMLGYFTKYGDGACDLQPLADVYKTSVRELAKHLGLPRRVYSKPSSPELWPGQTAAKELGIGYDKLDVILWGLERWMSPEDIAEETRMPVTLVKRVKDRWLGNEHKRRTPLVLKLGYRTAGYDLRLPYEGG